MTGAPLSPTAPAGTPVWVEVDRGISLPGITLAVPFRSRFIHNTWGVQVEIYGRGDLVAKTTEITRRKP
jgi:hypothetical protein